MTLLDLIILAGATAWLTTALVAKEGPLGLLAAIRDMLDYYLGKDNNPLQCFHCTSFWIGLSVAVVWYFVPLYSHGIISIFAVMGVGQALRGLSAEWK